MQSLGSFLWASVLAKDWKQTEQVMAFPAAIAGSSDSTKDEIAEEIFNVTSTNLLYNRTISAGHTVLFRLPSGDTRSLVINANQ